MPDGIDSRRRTVLRTLASLVAGTTAMTSVVGARSSSERSAETAAGTDRTGVYSGTVDRIVDGDHVVVLLERHGEVIDQVVVSSNEYPALEERDSVLVVVVSGEILTIREIP